MSELITHGFIQGHAATLGYFDGTVVPPAVFLSAFESLHGASPLIRIRFDLDNDDVYETVEMSSVMTTGGVDRVIEYLTNKPRFGSCDITLQNDDNRWSDFFSRSLTYSAGASKVRYHGKKGIVELGFDSFSSKDDTSWFPLFFGYISQKSEDAESRTVTISLLDEWSRILSVPLYKEIQGDSFFTYSDLSYVDNRMIGLGTYFGKHGFLFAEYLSKDNQLLVPCIHNQDDIDITYGSSTFTAIAYKAFRVQAYHYPMIDSDVKSGWIPYSETTNEQTIGDYNQIYIWGWNKDWFSNGKAQWLRVPKYASYTGSTTVFEQFIEDTNAPGQFYFQQPVYLVCYDSSGNKKQISFYNIINTENEDFEWKIGLSCNLESNPAKILFHVLTNMTELSFEDLDVSGNNTDNWLVQEKDYDDPSYYSFDTTANYLRLQDANMAVNIKSEYTVQQFIESICELSRGSFFIDKGRDISDDQTRKPLRRVHFVIHQPRYIPLTFKVLDEERIRGLQVYRDTNDVKNTVTVGTFVYSNTALKTDLHTYTNTDISSVEAYGGKEYEILNNANSPIFLYDSQYYANFLSQHYIALFAEPPIRLSFTTDLIGYNWDLKSLIGIRDRLSTMIDFDVLEGNVSGALEVYGVRINLSSFSISFDCKWAGYLLAPDGDVLNKSWAFWDHFYYGGKNGVTYHAW